MQTYLPDRKIGSFHPPHRTLMGPGPSDVHPRVLAAMSLPTVGYLDMVFVTMMDEVKTLLRYAFQTGHSFTFPVSGPGSTAMELCFVNMVNPGDTVIVCRNGVFGGRMIEMVERAGGKAVVVEDRWGDPVDPQKVEDALKANPDARIVAFVHAETSTGAQSDAAAIAEVARRHGCLTIMDAVTSLVGVPVLIDEWGIDAVYSATQKCLSCAPGLSPVSFSDRAVDWIKNRRSKCQSWFMDLNLVMGYWNSTKRTYHHTAPINTLYALHEALVMVQEEGLEHTWLRHERNHKALKAGLEAIGLAYVGREGARLPQLNAVWVPEGVNEAEVRGRLLLEYNLEIGAGLGDLAGKIWRFGLMGYSSRPENVALCLSALESVLSDQGFPVQIGAAEVAAHRVYAAHHQPADITPEQLKAAAQGGR